MLIVELLREKLVPGPLFVQLIFDSDQPPGNEPSVIEYVPD